MQEEVVESAEGGPSCGVGCVDPEESWKEAMEASHTEQMDGTVHQMQTRYGKEQETPSFDTQVCRCKLVAPLYM